MLKSDYQCRILPALLFLCTSAFLFGDIRESVAVIECTPNSAFIDSFSQIAERFERAGNSAAADYFNSLQEGWHGSGALMQLEDGEMVLLTNRHVTSHSEDMNIKFGDVDGDEVVLNENLSVLEDAQLDLALIYFDMTQEIAPLIPDFEMEISDGDQVYAAGYPSLLGEPSWQLSQGIVTNYRAEIDRLVDPDISHVIQHSASIDPGSSGGPLMVMDEDRDYRIIGINTWSVGGRQNTFFALPVEQVKRLLDRKKELEDHHSDPEWIEDDLNHSFNSFFSTLKAETWDSERDHPYISEMLAASQGWDSYLRLMRDGDSSTKEAMESQFDSLSPYDVLRESTAWSIWHTFRNQLGDKSFSFSGFGAAPTTLEEGTRVKGTIAVGNRELGVSMVFERGNWKLLSMEALFSAQKVKADYGEEQRQSKPLPEDLILAGLDLNPSLMNGSYDGEKSISGGHGFFEYLTALNEMFSLGLGVSLGYYNFSIDVNGEATDQNYVGFAIPLNLYARFPRGDNRSELIPYLGAGGSLDVYTSMFSSTEDEIDSSDEGLGLAYALVPRIGVGCDYLLPTKGWGAGIGLWKRFTLGSFSMSMGEESLPTPDDVSLRLYLLFRN